MVQSYKGILCSNENEQTTAIYDTSDSERYDLLYYSIYIKFRKRQNLPIVLEVRLVATFGEGRN